ncbi:MAG: ATPase [Anaerolineae bacterium]|nr:ATPase [Anaerolineae bacterium]
MAQCFLGYDIGGSNSRALIADAQGHVIGFGQAGAGSYEVVGWQGLQAALQAVTVAALASAGLSVDRIAGAGFGIAGYDWPGERGPHLEAIASLGLDAPFALVNDSIIGLIAGATEGWGIGIVAGTGANCWGRDRRGREGHTTGGAAMLGEYGGADTLVPEAICAVSRAFTRRGPTTTLTQAFVDVVGALGPEDLLEGLCMGRYVLSTQVAPLIFQAAAAGDAVSLDLIRWAGRGLGSLVVGVVRQLALEHEAFDVVQIGSLFGASSLLAGTMLATINDVAPGARLTQLTMPPVVGGVMLGMEAAGVDVRLLRETVASTAVALMAKG